MPQIPEKAGCVTSSERSWFVPPFLLDLRYILSTVLSGLFARGSVLPRPEFLVHACMKGRKQAEETALLQSPLRGRQLADFVEHEIHGRCTEKVIQARDPRTTGFSTHLLILESVFLKDALSSSIWILSVNGDLPL